MPTDVIMAAQYRIHPSLWGGMDEFLSAMHGQLSQRGISVAVAVPRLAGTDASHYHDRSIPCVVLDGRYFFDSLIEYCSRHPAKILHTHFMPTLSAKYRRFADDVGAIISTEHMSRPLRGWTLQKKIRSRASALIGERHVTEMVHVSRYLEEENIRFFGNSLRKKSTIINNGVGIAPLDKSYPEEISPGRKLKLVSAGRLVPEKGFSDLINVVQSITASHGPLVELDILGDGPIRADLERQAGDLLDATVFFRGYVNDVRDRLRQADLYVHPSFQEAFAFVLLEAGEAGMPSVAYDVGGNPEVIHDGFNGHLVPPRDIAGMADRILGYVEEPGKLGRQGKNARLRIESEFSVSRMVHDYVNLYAKYM